MADSTAPISAVNPELGRLINRAKTVLEMIGGADSKASLRGDKARTFDEKRDTIAIDMTSLEAVLDLRDNGKRSGVDQIRLNQQIRHGSMDITKAIADLMQTMTKEAAKRKSGLTAEVIAERREAVQDLLKRQHIIKDRYMGRSPGADDRPRLPGAIELSSLGPGAASAAGAGASGAGGGGGGGAFGGGPAEEEEDITEEQRLAMAQNEEMDKAIDSKLGEMESILDDILHANRGLKEALVEGDARIKDVTDHIGKTKDKLDRVTANIKRVLEVSDSRSSRCCTYLICLVVLLGIATVIFNVVSSSS